MCWLIRPKIVKDVTNEAMTLPVVPCRNSQDIADQSNDITNEAVTLLTKLQLIRLIMVRLLHFSNG